MLQKARAVKGGVQAGAVNAVQEGDGVVVDGVPEQGVDLPEKTLGVGIPRPPEVMGKTGQPFNAFGKVERIRVLANNFCHEHLSFFLSVCFNRHISPLREKKLH